ncbi:MAG TPA: hypothetical protein VLT45_09045 [Kofleriaceae bacterium]|nr:hypothetical protein [Kofleriaceae bacterium]
MNVRRLASAAATIVVAIVCALTVPATQLRTFSRVTTCCCPDPSHCHCPDHKLGPDGGPAMRACHRQATDFVAPVLPAFTPPEEVVLARAERAIPLAMVPLRTPHPAPALRRPDAPS